MASGFDFEMYELLEFLSLMRTSSERLEEVSLATYDERKGNTLLQFGFEA